MADVKHTDGPWVATPYGDILPEGANYLVASCFGNSGAYRNYEANVLLIAAAPELLHSTRALHFLCEKLMSELGIDAESTLFNFTADGESFLKCSAADFMNRATQVMDKATGGAARATEGSAT